MCPFVERAFISVGGGLAVKLFGSVIELVLGKDGRKSCEFVINPVHCLLVKLKASVFLFYG